MAGPDLTELELDDLREIVLHGITETACHAGYLDATRELIGRLAAYISLQPNVF